MDGVPARVAHAESDPGVAGALGEGDRERQAEQAGGGETTGKGRERHGITEGEEGVEASAGGKK